MHTFLIGAIISALVGSIAAIISRLKGDDYLLVFQAGSTTALVTFIIYCICYACSLNIQ